MRRDVHVAVLRKRAVMACADERRLARIESSNDGGPSGREVARGGFDLLGCVWQRMPGCVFEHQPERIAVRAWIDSVGLGRQHLGSVLDGERQQIPRPGVSISRATRCRIRRQGRRVDDLELVDCGNPVYRHRTERNAVQIVIGDDHEAACPRRRGDQGHARCASHDDE